MRKIEREREWRRERLLDDSDIFITCQFVIPHSQSIFDAAYVVVVVVVAATAICPTLNSTNIVNLQMRFVIVFSLCRSFELVWFVAARSQVYRFPATWPTWWIPTITREWEMERCARRTHFSSVGKYENKWIRSPRRLIRNQLDLHRHRISL